MADSKTSALSAIAAVLDTTEFPANDAGASHKVTGAQLEDYFGVSQRNQSLALQAPALTTLTYLTGSNIAVPAGKMRIGTRFRWRMVLTKTGAGTAARVFKVHIGTAGTGSDATILTFTTSIGSQSIDTAWVDIDVTIRGPLSSSCICAGSFIMGHDLAVTGFLTRALNVINVISSTFDATVANLIVGVSFTGGASELVTFQQVNAEALNL